MKFAMVLLVVFSFVSFHALAGEVETQCDQMAESDIRSESDKNLSIEIKDSKPSSSTAVSM